MFLEVGSQPIRINCLQDRLFLKTVHFYSGPFDLDINEKWKNFQIITDSLLFIKQSYPKYSILYKYWTALRILTLL